MAKFLNIHYVPILRVLHVLTTVHVPTPYNIWFSTDITP